MKRKIFSFVLPLTCLFASCNAVLYHSITKDQAIEYVKSTYEQKNSTCEKVDGNFSFNITFNNDGVKALNELGLTQNTFLAYMISDLVGLPSGDDQILHIINEIDIKGENYVLKKISQTFTYEEGVELSLNSLSTIHKDTSKTELERIYEEDFGAEEDKFAGFWYSKSKLFKMDGQRYMKYTSTVDPEKTGKIIIPKLREYFDVNGIKDKAFYNLKNHTATITMPSSEAINLFYGTITYEIYYTLQK